MNIALHNEYLGIDIVYKINKTIQLDLKNSSNK